MDQSFFITAASGSNIPPNLNDIQLVENLKLTFLQGAKILIFSTLAGVILRKIYMRYSLTFSSPRNFGNTILLVLLCVSALIAVVKSSLALSLGLVGALSVIRFRTAVKEPYTLSFILLSVCIGIAIGAEQFLFAISTLFVGTIITIVLSNFESKDYKSSGLFSSNCEMLTIIGESRESTIEAINIAKKYSRNLNLKSLNSSKESTIASIQIEINDLGKLDEISKEISLIKNIKNISFYNSPN